MSFILFLLFYFLFSFPIEIGYQNFLVCGFYAKFCFMDRFTYIPVYIYVLCMSQELYDMPKKS